MAVNLSEENKTLRKRINDIATDWQAKEVENQQLRNRVAELEEANKLLEADAKRYEWVLDNCTTVGGGHGVQVSFFVPVDHEDLSCAIDMAMENKNDR